MTRYVIEPQWDIADEGADGTHFVPCNEEEAEHFAVFAIEDGAPEGDAELVEDFETRADAETWIKGAVILDGFLGNGTGR